MALGLNHRTAPIDVRSRFSFQLPQLAPTLHGFRRQDIHLSAEQPIPDTTPEVALLSTCNRTDLYFATDSTQPRHLVGPTLDWLARHGGMTSGELVEHVYVLHGAAAARHAFRVACGLDSMVLGEPQILGQMKQAVREAESAGTLGTALHHLFQRSFSVAKEVRTSTEIGAHSISMAAASVRLAAQLFEDLRDIKVLLIGAGEMVELVATHFAARCPRALVVANRTLERGERLARRFGAQAIRLAELPHRLYEFDAVVSCTASSLPIIGLGAIERALRLRKQRPMFILDLSVPRDIEPEVAHLDDVYLYSIDDLSKMVQSAGERRQAAIEQAEAIVETGVQSFEHWLELRETVPLIQALNTQTNCWRAASIERAHKQLAGGEDVTVVLDSLTRGLTQKMLHGTLVELRTAAPERRVQLAQTVSRLFLRNGTHNPSGDGQ